MYAFKNEEERRAVLSNNKFELYKKAIEGVIPVAFIPVLQLLKYMDKNNNFSKDIKEGFLGLVLVELVFLLIDSKEVKERKEEIYKMLGYSISPDLYPYGYTDSYSEEEVKQLIKK